MGLFKFIEKRKIRKESEKYFAEEREIQEPIRLEIEKEDYEGAYNLAKEAYQSNMFDGYCTQTKLVICIRLIDICYKLNKDDESEDY